MFKIHYGTCIKCNQSNVIIPVKSGLCRKCNYEKKQESKLNARTKYSFIKDDKPSVLVEKRRLFSISERKKATGEKEIFKEIAETQEHSCFVCGRTIGELTVSNFAHILPKALNKYPLFKLNIDNIKLFCHDSYSSCHHRFDKEPRSSLTEPMWQKVFELEKQLKEEYIIFKNNKL